MKAFFPMSRWWSALTLLLTLYILYGVFAPILDNNFTNLVNDMSGNWIRGQYANEITANVTNNFFVGVVILFFGLMFFMFIAGIPGQQEERII